MLATVTAPKMAVTCGVPQGSILGPLLFLLHFNEFPELLYVDDTVLYFHNKNLDEIEKAITNDLEILSDWLPLMHQFHGITKFSL